MAVREHKAHAPASVACGVITVSDTRTDATDESGRLIRELLAAGGHKVAAYAIVKDEASAILAALDRVLPACDVVITNGGTGLSPRDVTIETVTPEMDKVLPGFGELFRMLSHRDIGSAAMMSRAVAGTFRGKLVFCLPGSPEACALAVKSLILPELGHAVGVMRR
ncbi:MAG: molybdenum cofactor biosynthesis protein MoaB [Methanobacteriota archaeon]|nr:MAG: molybdenum cofactor biosynthesis protein MoaB [Euryarchaeota archaeon]